MAASPVQSPTSVVSPVHSLPASLTPLTSPQKSPGLSRSFKRSLSVSSPGAPVLQQGAIQPFHGYLSRQSGVLKRWKRAAFAVVPEQPTTTIVKCKKDGNKLVHSFSYFNPDVEVKCGSQDPKSDDFLSFSVIDKKNGKTVESFRADDIVQMRNFMASLGSTNVGVFSPKSVFAFDLPDVEPADESQGSTGTYIDTVKQLPTAFYYPKSFGLVVLDPPAGVKPVVLSKPLPNFSASLPKPSKENRQWSDTFRPPIGPTVYQPISMGYGAEVGLKIGQQAIWDPLIKSYCLLDHKDKKRVNGDPRKLPKKAPPLSQQYHRYGSMYRYPDIDNMYIVYRDSAVLTAAKCAKLKPHAWTLVACGSKGNDGRNGQCGISGAHGHPGVNGIANGAHGGAGVNGGVGGSAFDGQPGEHGTAASDIVLLLNGDANELKIKGTCTMVAKLGGLQHEEVLFVDCRGGDGGKGGNGGHAGNGGDAGAGGYGAPGKKGMDAFGYGQGFDGKPGGNGGNGGNGGAGGVGGSGARGGDAGEGGVCIISTSDPKLMMLVEADCTAGIHGKGGSAGKGGKGGTGGIKGIGGPGGPGGRGTIQTSYIKDNVKYITNHDAPGNPGRPGYDGNDGIPGSSGKDGVGAEDGSNAKHGGIAWVVLSKDGTEKLQQSPTRYSVQIMSFQVNCEHNDNIFEPNEQITVSDIVVVNNGGLPLPAGAELLMETSETVNFEPTRFKLPEIMPGKSVKVQSNFRGRIFDLPTPFSPGPLLKSAEFRSRVELLGRPFLDSLVSRKLEVRYPVKLASLKCNENVGRDEVTTFEIEVENISDKPYGSCEGSAGEIGVQIQMDAQLIPFASANNDTSPLYTITYNALVRNSLYVEIHKLQPKEKLQVRLVVQLSAKADLFHRCDWQANLCLRGKVIEYNFQKIRVSPIYTPRSPPADILMVTSSTFTHRDFIYWKHIFEILGASTDFWDTTRYRGFSEDTAKRARHSLTWVGQYRGRLILFPQFNCSLLQGKDIVDHFHGDVAVGQQERINLGSGMILFLPFSPPRDIHVEKKVKHGDATLILLNHLANAGESLPLPKGGYSGKHVTKPTSVDSCLKWEENALQQLEKEDPSRSVCVASRKVDIQSKGMMKYSYGEVDLRRCPLKRSCKFVVMDGAGGSIAFMGKDDPNFSNETETCPLGSSFGQALLHTLYGLPLHFKLALMKGLRPNLDETSLLQASQITFSLPNEFSLTLDQLSAICAAREIADEVLDGSKSLGCSKLFLKDVQDNMHIYSNKPEIVTQTLSLLEKELQAYKKSFDFSAVSQAIKDCKKILSQVQKETQSSTKKKRRSSSNEQVLPRLAQLQDSLRVHYSHRHVVKDDRWNLDFRT